MPSDLLRSGRYNPCKGCKDRYPACSDHCEKPDKLAWNAEQEKIREAKRRYDETTCYTADMIRKCRRVRK